MGKTMTVQEWDAEMKRWRHPYSPEWVVYTPQVDAQTGCWASTLFNEQTGEHYLFSRRYNGDEIPEVNKEAHTILDDYFNDNPNVLPWYKATKGEIWELILNENSDAYASVVCLAISDRHFLPLDNAFLYNVPTDKRSFREFREMREDAEIIKFSNGHIFDGKLIWSPQIVSNEDEYEINMSTTPEENENKRQKYSDNSYNVTDDIYDNEESPVITDNKMSSDFLK